MRISLYTIQENSIFILSSNLLVSRFDIKEYKTNWSHLFFTFPACPMTQATQVTFLHKIWNNYIWTTKVCHLFKIEITNVVTHVERSCIQGVTILASLLKDVTMELWYLADWNTWILNHPLFTNNSKLMIATFCILIYHYVGVPNNNNNPLITVPPCKIAEN